MTRVRCHIHAARFAGQAIAVMTTASGAVMATHVPEESVRRESGTFGSVACSVVQDLTWCVIVLVEGLPYRVRSVDVFDDGVQC